MAADFDSKTILCRMCQEQGKPAKAHIVPNGFFASFKNEIGQIETLALDFPYDSKTLQSGAWDRELLCQHCETDFHRLDTIGIRFFRDEKYCAVSRKTGAHSYLQVIAGADAEALKRFLLFLTWRIGMSKRPEFANVDLGIHAERMRSLLLSTNPISSDNFPIVIARNWGTSRVGDSPAIPLAANQIWLNPCVFEQLKGRRALQVWLGNYDVRIAIDQRPAEGFWATQSLAPGRILIFHRKWEDSKSLELIRRRIFRGS